MAVGKIWQGFAVIIAFIALLSLRKSTEANGANILGVFTSHSPSHLIVHMSLVKALAEKGHNVTVVTTLQPKVTHESIQQIVIDNNSEEMDKIQKQVGQMAAKKQTMLGTFLSLSNLISQQADVLKDARFTALYENKDNKFDLVIVGFFMNDYQLGVAAKFKCPLVVSWSGAPMEFVNRFVGNPVEISYVPTMRVSIKAGEAVGFVKRLQNLLVSLIFNVFHFIIDMQMDKYYNDLFGKELNFPTRSDMYKNISLLFCNSHFSEGPIRPNVPSVIEIGGIQAKDTPSALPQDIAEFLANAKQGAILFSLGSNLKSDFMQPATIEAIYNTLSTLKQRVIFKWDNLNNTPGNSSNILFKSWLPQDDILAHPNLKLFITHAGKGGLAEAQYHGIPMLAFPSFGDQQSNSNNMVNAGYGLQLDMLSLKETDFKAAVLELLENPVYRNNIMQFSRLYRDRPMTAKQTVVYWVEYVLRHRGAAHLQSALMHMNAIQAANLDVYVCLILVFYLIYKLFQIIFVCLMRKIFRLSRDNKKCSSSSSAKTKKKIQ